MPIEVLLIEDSPGDARLMQEVFREANGAARLHLVADGLDAMDFLRRKGTHAGAPRPDIVLLDLNLPKMDGREILAEIKGDEHLKMVPTVVLTTSEAHADILRSYELHANCYIVKPMHLEAFEKLMRAVSDFWLHTVKLPQPQD